MHDIQRLFQRLAPQTPPHTLLAAVLARVHAAAHARARRVLWSMGILGTLSLGALVTTVTLLTRQASDAGFFQYLSLALSDGGVAISHWQEYGLSLVETLPLTMLVLTLASLAAVMASVRRAASVVSIS